MGFEIWIILQTEILLELDRAVGSEVASALLWRVERVL